MIDFSTVTGITVPEGVVTKIECGGVVLWERISDTVILEVEKITSDTYANNTTYTGEQFILLDIYPKTNGTVNVTYGDLTKTITDSSGADEPAAQQVFFGTFNSVSDEVATPASGTLKISGDYRGFGCASFNSAKSTTTHCGCVAKIRDLGLVEIIPSSAFYNCTKIENATIPSSVTSIGNNAFDECIALASIDVDNRNENYSSDGGVLLNKNKTELIRCPCAFNGHYTIPTSVTSIKSYAFHKCMYLTSVDMSMNVTDIGLSAFRYCNSLTSITIPSGVTVINSNTFSDCNSLTSITIPSSVISLEMKCFFLSSGNTRYVTMLSESPPALDAQCFHELGTNHFIVPTGCGEVYKTSGSRWKEYADYITEASA